MYIGAMFHWICPECGREIPPSVKECSICDPQAAPVPTPVLTAVAVPAVSEGPARPLVLPSIPQLDPLLGLAQKLRDTQREVQEAQREARQVDAIAAVAVEEPPAEVEAPVEAPAEAKEEAAADVAPADVAVADVPPAAEVPGPAEILNVPNPPYANADLLITGPLLLVAPPSPIALLAPVTLPRPLDAEPQAPELPEVRPLSDLNLADAGLSELAEAVANPLAIESVAQEAAPVEPAISVESAAPELAAIELDPIPPAAAEPEMAAPAEAGRVSTPEPALSPVALAARSHQETYPLPVPPAAPPSVERESALGSRALGMAPLQDSSAIGNRIRAAASTPQILRNAETSDPSVTLPGPALPKALNSLEEAGLSKILVDRPRQERSGGRAWVTGGLAAMALLGALLGMQLYNAPRSSASTAPVPAVAHEAAQATETPASPAAPIPLPAATPATSYSLAKAVEVTGLRFTDGKPEVRYLVVNHSAAALGSVTVYVTLQNSATRLPLSHFSFKAPALGPNESKEMVSALDKTLHAADWQNVRADIELGQ